MLDIQGIIHFNIFHNLFSWKSIVLFIALFQFLRDKQDKGTWLFLYFAFLINIPRVSYWSFSELLTWTFPLGLIFLGILSLGKNDITQSKKFDINSFNIESMPKKYFLKTNYLALKGHLSNLFLSIILSKITIDLRDCQMDILNPPIIQSTSIFSSYTLIISPICKIQTNGYQLFSTLKDTRRSSLIKINSSESHNLSLQIMNIFSYIEIQSHE